MDEVTRKMEKVMDEINEKFVLTWQYQVISKEMTELTKEKKAF